MKDPKEYRSGVIIGKEHNYVFHSEGYCFTFMDSEVNSHNLNPITPTKDGFILGKLHDGHDIGIYVGQTKDFPILSHRQVITGVYYEYSSFLDITDPTSLWGIEFCGGTLNMLLDRSKSSFDFADGKIVVDNATINNDYTLQCENEEWTISIGSMPRFSNGVSGLSVRDSGVYIRILFPTKKTVGDFLRIHSIVREMISFMTFRRNVGFDEIHFLKQKDDYGFNQRCAQVFVRNDEPLTSKGWFRSITFDDFGDNLPNLFKFMFCHNDSEASYMLGFLPQNDNEVMKMSPMRLREVCSALECELSFVADLKPDEEQNLTELVKEIKKLIKTHRKGSSRLSDKTYDVIHGSIEHWSLALSDRIYLLYQQYEDIIINMIDTRIVIGAEEINKFVKFRNNITHGRHRIIDQTVGTTAAVLQGLVYCCLLTRLGIERDNLETICTERRLLY